MQLTIVYTVLGQHDLATLAISNALENCSDTLTNIVVVDNGGDYEYPYETNGRVIVERRIDTETLKPMNMGVYPVFKYAFDVLSDVVTGDIVAFLHSDLIITEKGFDARIIAEFTVHKALGLIGFVGSNEIDNKGGRGVGTTSNFQGFAYTHNEGTEDNTQIWRGSPAEAHGMRNAGFTPAAVVDGCAMVVSREAWKRIGFREDFPPHHFYDRLISTQMLEHHLEVGVLGIACDHISGQTVAKESRYSDLAKEWCEKNGVAPTHNHDDAIYREAEKRWLYEYRQVKGIVPVRV